MNRALGMFFTLALVAVPTLAQEVHIDYAHGFDFDGVATFQYVDTAESNIQDNPLMAERVAAAIRQQLVEGGLKEVSENPDLYVTYHFTTKERTQYSTSTFGYGGYWDDWYGWGAPSMGSATTTVTTYTDGTLIIDAYDGAEKKMVWRGTGTVTLKAKPDKQMKQMERILAKMGAKWKRILAGRGK